eukprot:TRINITY_DN5730_c0_g1_i1.p4 TRINITY_DN5730_c0_g1~~TRINITY_DN5730_c0_g1_i1.p4  ORF type:complete len:115 (-),score=6.76 TRINITY_DN5730_c0_g1_i1:107-451(-)
MQNNIYLTKIMKLLKKLENNGFFMLKKREGLFTIQNDLLCIFRSRKFFKYQNITCIQVVDQWEVIQSQICWYNNFQKIANCSVFGTNFYCFGLVQLLGGNINQNHIKRFPMQLG